MIANTAKGLIATVNDNYKASERSKNDLSLADVVLNVDSSVNVDMSAVGGLFGYVINGGEAASTLQGSPLSDSITGNVRADLLIGGRGNDTIEGGGGADRIITGAGNNVVKDAGIGADIITHSGYIGCYTEHWK